VTGARAAATSAAAALALLLAVPASAGATPVATAAAGTTPATAGSLDCGSLSGSGSYGDPSRIGTVSGPVVISGCSPLRSGAGLAVRYFSFDLAAAPSSSSLVLTRYRPGAGPTGVHPRLSSGPRTLKGSRQARFVRSGGYEGFAHTLADVAGTGPWRVGAEKLSSPLGSTVTSPYDVVIVP
jgi:hypothetical protein